MKASRHVLQDDKIKKSIIYYTPEYMCSARHMFYANTVWLILVHINLKVISGSSMIFLSSNVLVAIIYVLGLIISDNFVSIVLVNRGSFIWHFSASFAVSQLVSVMSYICVSLTATVDISGIYCVNGRRCFSITYNSVGKRAWEFQPRCVISKSRPMLSTNSRSFKAVFALL